MQKMTIRNLTGYPIPLNLRYQHEGVAGRTIYLTPRGRVEAPASVAEENDVKARVANGQVDITLVNAEAKKEKTEKPKNPAPEKKGWRAKREKLEE